VFVVCSVACEYVSLRMDPRVCFIECFLSLLYSADEGKRIVWRSLCFIPVVLFVPMKFMTASHNQSNFVKFENLSLNKEIADLGNGGKTLFLCEDLISQP
jgi:hypothetical protein